MATSDESNSLNVLVPSSEQQKPSSEAYKPSNQDKPRQSNEPLKSKPSAKTGGLWFFTIFNLLILITLISAAAWYYLTIWQSQTAQQANAIAQVDQQQSIVEALRGSQVSLTQQVEQALQTNANTTSTLGSALSQSQQKVVQLEQQLAQTQLKLAELGGRRPADWLIAEADYLVRMAGRKLWLESDDRSALMLLAAADSRLADLNDSSLLPIRALLAEDIQALRQLNPVSLTSVALSISGMIPQVDNLPIATLKLPDLAEGESLEPLTNSVSDWRENLRRTWDSIVDGFISVKTRDMPVEPLMSEQAQWLVKEQLSFALLQAKSAALQGQATLYQQSLQRALAILVEDFELTAIEVEQFSAALQNLQQTNIERTFPQQFRAQQPLTDRLNERMSRLFSNGERPL